MPNPLPRSRETTTYAIARIASYWSPRDGHTAELEVEHPDVPGRVLTVPLDPDQIDAAVSAFTGGQRRVQLVARFTPARDGGEANLASLVRLREGLERIALALGVSPHTSTLEALALNIAERAESTPTSHSMRATRVHLERAAKALGFEPDAFSLDALAARVAQCVEDLLSVDDAPPSAPGISTANAARLDAARSRA